MGRDAHSTRFFFVLIFRRPVSRLKLREISIPAEISENAYAERRRAACPNRMALYAGDASRPFRFADRRYRAFNRSDQSLRPSKF
jgi:hypothetical protein